MTAAPLFSCSDGRAIRVNFRQFDEHHRRLRLRLPKEATCWDYAPLVDITCRAEGLKVHRLTGLSAAQWESKLRSSLSPDLQRFRRWYEAVITPMLPVLGRRPRVPENHYCVELAAPPFVPSLPDLIRGLRLKRATVEQWSATLKSLTGRGLKPEELELSGVLQRLDALADGATPTEGQLLRMVDLSHATPRLATEAKFGFVASAGWKECCERIPMAELRRRGRLQSSQTASRHIRFSHRSLGWSVVHTRYRDLVSERQDWWSVMDERRRLVEQPAYGFNSPEEAMRFAELEMNRRFRAWGKDLPLPAWERYALRGGDGYSELLLQLNNWPGSYKSSHYRTRNILVHIRSSIRQTPEGRRVLYLDEVQSDWHGDLHLQSKSDGPTGEAARIPEAPFRKEWPLLSLKVMLWWAQRLGVDGVAWSTADLQFQRWGRGRPPEALYRTALPEAARALARTLDLSYDVAKLHIRDSSREVRLGPKGWLVCNEDDEPITKAFPARAQAECFANQIGHFRTIEVPTLWIADTRPLRSIPLYGLGNAAAWY